MKKEIIATDKAPAALAGYNQAIKVGDLIFTAGQLGFDPKTGEFAGDDVAIQTKQALENIKAIVEAAGSNMEKMVKVTIFLSDINHYGEVNKVYGQYFTTDFPARSVVEAANLPKNALIEIEAIAVV